MRPDWTWTGSLLPVFLTGLLIFPVYANVDFVPAWPVLPGQTLLNAPHLQPPTGGVACFGLSNFDPAAQVPICVFTTSEAKEEIARTDSFPFSFLEVLARFPEVLPAFAADDARASALVNDTGI